MNDQSKEGQVGKHIEIALVVALLLLQLILIKFSASVPSHRFLFIFFFFNMIIVPGYLISRMIFPVIEIPVRVLLAFVFGTAIVFMLLMIFAFFHVDVFFLGIVVPVLSVILVIGGKRIPSSFTDKLEDSTIPRRISRRNLVILLCLLAFVVTLIIAHGDPLMYTSDSADHIAYIRSICLSHEAFPEQFLYKDGGTLTRDIRKGLMHSVWGALNILTGRKDVAAIWPLISAIASLFTVLAFFCAGFLVFNSSAIGLIASFIFVFIQGGGLGSYRLITAAFSFPTGKIFSLVFLISTLRYLENNKLKYLILMTAATIAGTGTHIGHFIVNLFIIFYAVVGRIIEGSLPERKRLITKTAPLIVLVTVCAGIPYLLMRYVRDYAPNNVIHSHLQGVFWITDNLYTINPVTLFLQVGLPGLLGFLSVFILWDHSRKDKNLRLLLWGTIALWGLLFNPILVPSLMKTISYLVFRLIIAAPATLVTAILVKTIWDKLKGREIRMSKMAAVIGSVAVIAAFGYQLAITPSNFAYSKKTDSKLRYSCYNTSDICEYIADEIPAGSIIASDPLTSYCIPAFTDQFVVCTNDQHSIPNDSTALDRIIDCRDIFSPLSTMSEIANILKKHKAGYIVVNGRIPVTTGTHYWKPDREMAVQAISRFSDYPMFFELVYGRDNAAVFRITGNMESHVFPERDESVDYEFIGREIGENEIAEIVPSETPGIFIKSVRPEKSSVKRGEWLKLDIEWVAVENCPYRSYVAHIRFDTSFEKGALYREYYGKIYRKILETYNSTRYRFRYDHLPLSGLFTPDRWPHMQIVKDSMVIKIPEDISAGTYIISVKMTASTHYPNYSFRDLLNDDDSYDGPDMSSIVVE